MQTSISTTQLAFSSLVTQQNNQNLEEDEESETGGNRTSRFIEAMGAV